MQAGAQAALRRIEGRFWRTVREDRLAQVLDPPGPESAGRYHRPGEAVLYMSPRAEWARIAVSGYARDDGVPRLVVPLDLDAALVVDQRDEAACLALGIDRALSNASWQQALARGEEPPSWRNAAAARAAGADGIVDVSRKIPGGWHLNLFRWNTAGAPTVRVAGPAEAVSYPPGGARWS